MPVIFFSDNGHAAPQTVLDYCLALDAYAEVPVETVRQALQQAHIPWIAPASEWVNVLTRAGFVINQEVPPCS